MIFFLVYFPSFVLWKFFFFFWVELKVYFSFKFLATLGNLFLDLILAITPGFYFSCQFFSFGGPSGFHIHFSPPLNLCLLFSPICWRLHFYILAPISPLRFRHIYEVSEIHSPCGSFLFPTYTQAWVTAWTLELLFRNLITEVIQGRYFQLYFTLKELRITIYK